MMITPRQSCSCEEVATQEAAKSLGVAQPLCCDAKHASGRDHVASFRVNANHSIV